MASWSRNAETMKTIYKCPKSCGMISSYQLLYSRRRQLYGITQRVNVQICSSWVIIQGAEKNKQAWKVLAFLNRWSIRVRCYLSRLYSTCAIERHVEVQRKCSGSNARPWHAGQLSVHENAHEVQEGVCPVVAKAELGWRRLTKWTLELILARNGVEALHGRCMPNRGRPE